MIEPRMPRIKSSEGIFVKLTVSHDHVGISLRPDDLDATIDWYTSSLDLGVHARFDVGGVTFVHLTGAGVRLELMTGATNPPEAPGKDFVGNIFASLDPARLHHVCFAVSDLDATLSELADRGVQLLDGPMEVSPIGQRVAFITDNIGTIIELSEPGTWPSGRRG